MGKITTFNQLEINKIIQLYTSGEVSSTHKLAEFFHTSHKKISIILKENKIEINNKGGQQKYFNKINYRDILKQYESRLIQGYKFVVICKHDGKQFNDYLNTSGALTIYLKQLFPDLEIPSQFLRKEYAKENGKLWHEQHFDITQIEIESKDVIKCKYCDWETIDKDNLSGWYQNHLKKEHNKEIEDYIIEFPEELSYFKKYEKKLKRIKLFDEDENSYIACEVCGFKAKRLSSEHLQTHNLTVEQYKLKYGVYVVCNNEIQRSIDMFQYYNENGLTVCFTSKPEKEIASIFEQYNINTELNNRKILHGKEIDVYLPNYNLGIEYNGNLFHSENYGKDKDYHLNKTILANQNGCSLIHIFEDEWQYKKDIVISKLLYMLHINNDDKIKIRARKCNIKGITNEQKNDFLEKYHIEGKDSDLSIKLGAFYNDELVGVITFLKTNNKKQDSYNLLRFVINPKYIIIGLASRMLKKFINSYKPDRIISFGDRRWILNSDNNIYTKLGFKLAETLPPDYKYYNRKSKSLERVSKLSFNKKDMCEKHGISMDLTQDEVTNQLGYEKVWDCGTFKYELIIK